MKFRILIAAALFAVPALAEDVDCKNAVTQADMSMCANMDYQKSDKKLNEAYGRLMSVLDDAGYKEKLKAAQKSWIQFRDNECTYETAENEGGTIHPMVYSMCLTRLTDTRTKDLKALLVCQKNAEKCGM